MSTSFVPKQPPNRRQPRAPPPPPRSTSQQTEMQQPKLPHKPVPPPKTSPLGSPAKQLPQNSPLKQQHSSSSLKKGYSPSTSGSNIKQNDELLKLKYLNVDRNYETLKNIARKGEMNHFVMSANSIEKKKEGLVNIVCILSTPCTLLSMIYMYTQAKPFNFYYYPDIRRIHL